MSLFSCPGQTLPYFKTRTLSTTLPKPAAPPFPMECPRMPGPSCIAAQLPSGEVVWLPGMKSQLLSISPRGNPPSPGSSLLSLPLLPCLFAVSKGFVCFFKPLYFHIGQSFSHCLNPFLVWLNFKLRLSSNVTSFQSSAWHSSITLSLHCGLCSCFITPPCLHRAITTKLGGLPLIDLGIPRTCTQRPQLLSLSKFQWLPTK